jgi:serine/threonine protein kinase
MSDLAEQPTVGLDDPGDEPARLAPAVFANRYEVRRVLGEGGMGTVYRVHDRELSEDVALKVLRGALADDDAATDRFRREVKLARRVTHPNVARTYDVGKHETTRFLTMELVEGEPLSSILARGLLPLIEALRIAEQIA